MCFRAKPLGFKRVTWTRTIADPFKFNIKPFSVFSLAIRTVYSGLFMHCIIAYPSGITPILQNCFDFLNKISGYIFFRTFVRSSIKSFMPPFEQSKNPFSKSVVIIIAIIRGRFRSFVSIFNAPWEEKNLSCVMLGLFERCEQISVESF